MNTEQTATPKKFKRVKLGINPITVSRGETRTIEILSDNIEVFTKRDGEEIDFVLVKDLDSNEEGHFWVGGQVRYHLEEARRKLETLMGLKLEITNKGQEAVELKDRETGKLVTREVNQYDVYELQ